MKRAASRMLTAATLLSAAWPARAEIRHEGGPRSTAYRAYLEYAMEGEEEGLHGAADALGESAFLAVEQARAARRVGDRERVVERAERALELDPESLAAHELLAYHYFAIGPEESLDDSERLLEKALEHGEAYVRLGGHDGELFDRLAQVRAWRARRAGARGRPAEAAAERRKQRRLLETWAERTHDLRAYEKLHQLADETLDEEGDVPHLRAHAARLPAARRRGLLLTLSRRLSRLDRCEAALPYLEEAASMEGLHPNDAIPIHVRLGRCANQAGRPDLAESALRRALELDPTNDAVVQDLADAHWVRGQVEEAAELWDAFSSRVARRTAVLERRARWELSVGEVEAALEHARATAELVAVDPEAGDAVARVDLLVARALLETGHGGDAEAVARRVREHRPEDPQPVLFLASLLWDEGRREEAVELLDHHAKAHSRDRELAGSLAGWEIERRLWKPGLRHLRRYLDAPTDDGFATERDVLARERLGALLFMRAGRLPDAEALLRRALGRAPTPIAVERELAFLLADVLVGQARVEEAVALVDDVVARSTAGPYLLEERVTWELRHRFGKDAVAHAEEALELLQKRGDATPLERARFQALRGDALLVAGRPEEAVGALEEALAVPAWHPPGRHVQLGRALEAAGRPEEAVPSLRAAGLRQPRSPVLKAALGRALLAAGDAEAGAAVLTALVEARPNPSSSLVQRVALDLAVGGAHAAARALMDDALRRRPHDPDCWIASGTVRDRAGDVDGAIADFRRALEIEPGNPTAHNGLGYLLAVHGRRLDEAVKLVRKALDLRPDEGSYLDSLGWAFFRLGRLAEAEEALVAAASRERDPVIVMHLGRLREAQGRTAEALELYQQALRQGLTEDEELVLERVAELSGSADPVGSDH